MKRGSETPVPLFWDGKNRILQLTSPKGKRIRPPGMIREQARGSERKLKKSPIWKDTRVTGKGRVGATPERECLIQGEEKKINNNVLLFPI